ncbi:Olfactory receptor 52N4 [Cricetulus griseus]|uniref:Olfactory receptor 52N4 n=3 Tax=Cricetulus griseus TaxID=10029 RepID=G3IGE1_CRIGR|nr:Olfactory receptor 52N4 [Cricetulus griseus]
MLTFLRGVILVIPFTFLTKRLPYCRGNVITHTYYDHMSVGKISCDSVAINAIYGLMVALFIGGFDILCITVSYTMILWAVVSLSLVGAQQKAFSTCTAHISAIVITYVPAFFTFFTNRFGRHTIPPHIHIIMTNLYLFMPPTMKAGFMHGIQGEHQKFVGIFLLLPVEAVVKFVEGCMTSVESPLIHLSFQSTHCAASWVVTAALRVLPGEHVVGEWRRVCQTLQGCIKVAAVACVQETRTHAEGPPPTRNVLAPGSQLCCPLSIILVEVWGQWI